jgi:uncharacterized Rossmann fold enzyme
MTNFIEKFGEDVLKVVEFPFKYTAQVARVLDSAIADSPEIKGAVIELIKEAETVIGDGSASVAQKGINLQSDAATLAAAEAFFLYFKGTFCPLVAKIYAEVQADLK